MTLPSTPIPCLGSRRTGGGHAIYLDGAKLAVVNGAPVSESDVKMVAA